VPPSPFVLASDTCLFFRKHAPLRPEARFRAGASAMIWDTNHQHPSPNKPFLFLLTRDRFHVFLSFPSPPPPLGLSFDNQTVGPLLSAAMYDAPSVEAADVIASSSMLLVRYLLSFPRRLSKVCSSSSPSCLLAYRARPVASRVHSPSARLWNSPPFPS